MLNAKFLRKYAIIRCLLRFSIHLAAAINMPAHGSSNLARMIITYLLELCETVLGADQS